MKRKISILTILLLALVILLSGCGDSKDSAKTTEEPQIILVTPSPEQPQSSVSPDQSPAPTQEPAATPSPSPTPTPTPTPRLTVTKHPTGETLSVGMTTWFVARADNFKTLTWQFLDASGNIHSVNETMTLNPGLELDVLDNETIQLSSVPISLNKWSCRAMFDGIDGSVQYTSAASITVVSVDNYYYSKYSSVIDNYKALKYGGNDTYGLFTDLGVTEELKYSLTDIDGDGEPELFVSCPDSSGGKPWNQVIYSMFRLDDNGKPVKVFQSYVRDRYMYSGLGFIHEGSGGAFDSECMVCSYYNGSLYTSEGIFTESSDEAPGGCRYCRVTGGDKSTGQITEITQDQFDAFQTGYEGSVRILTYSSFK